jgi:hypothetical protein
MYNPTIHHHHPSLTTKADARGLTTAPADAILFSMVENPMRYGQPSTRAREEQTTRKKLPMDDREQHERRARLKKNTVTNTKE